MSSMHIGGLNDTVCLLVLIRKFFVIFNVRISYIITEIFKCGHVDREDLQFCE